MCLDKIGREKIIPYCAQSSSFIHRLDLTQILKKPYIDFNINFFRAAFFPANYCDIEIGQNRCQ